MATRLIVRESSGSVQVSLHRAGVVVADPAGPPQRLPAPLSAQEMEDLRWYLEDYLQAPFAVYEERGAAIQGRIDEWGRRLFEALFGPGKPGRDAYLRARSIPGGWSLWLASDSPGFLALPWELMRDPDSPDPLALDVSVSRTIDVQEEPASASGEELRVLMVIARPDAERDAGYRVIARSLVERLPAVSGRVTVDVVRPPTLDELRQRLRRAREEGRPYQAVHFDGHGTFGVAAGRTGGGHLQFGQAPRGYLAFEKETGGEDLVPAEDFGAVLKGAGVPLLVFNACRSGTLADGGTAEAAVATRVLHAGAAAVVAMSYSVYVVAAAEFMAAFYESLFRGDTVEEAVRAGRRQMHRADLRPSPKGMLPLDDWMVPVHYARSEVSFPGLVRAQEAGGPSLDALLARMRPGASASAESSEGVHAEGSLDAVGGVFVGRDRDFVCLEAALRHRRVVVLHGMGGTGKTELAKAFARWLRDTGGVDDPGLVFFHSFEPGIASFGLSGVVTGIGLRVLGPDFVRHFPDTAGRAAAILQLMRESRALLVWDNFETVFSMPDPSGTTPALGEVERGEVRDFLAEVARSAKGGVIVTSRSREEWLGDVHRMNVGGLDRSDAVRYADVLLAPYPAAQVRRMERAFGELLQALDGHPLGMRLTLLHLEQSDAAALLRSLHEATPGSGSAGTPTNRLTSLDTCIHYSFQHLPEEDRRLLPALTLFEGVCDADVLRAMGESPEAPERFRDIGRERWVAALDRCVSVGLLTPVGSGIYRIHPALPPYLDGLWREQAGSDYVAAIAAGTRALTWACAGLGAWALSQMHGVNAEFAFVVVRQLRRTFGRNVLAAIDSEDFRQAQAILQPLFEVLKTEGSVVELNAWADRCRNAVEGPLGEVPTLDSDAGALWLLVVSAEANVALESHDLSGAEASYMRIVPLLRQSRSATARARLAVAYHMLGMVVQERGDLSAAEEWYRMSLGIKEEFKDRHGAAGSYHQLGIVAQRRGDLSAAEGWYRKSLEVLEELGNRPDMAGSYHQLGVVAQRRGDFSAAAEWYRKSLAIKEELGNRPGMATSYHQLGRLAHERGDFPAAENWYRKSLVIEEGLGNRPGMAISYHQFGMLAQERGDFPTAEEWYRKALTIFEELGNRPEMAVTLAQVAVLKDQQGRRSEALEWTVRSVVLFPDFPNRMTGTAPAHMARLTRLLGFPELEAAWNRVVGVPLPGNVRNVVMQVVEHLQRQEAGDADA